MRLVGMWRQLTKIRQRSNRRPAVYRRITEGKFSPPIKNGRCSLWEGPKVWEYINGLLQQHRPQKIKHGCPIHDSSRGNSVQPQGACADWPACSRGRASCIHFIPVEVRIRDNSKGEKPFAQISSCTSASFAAESVEPSLNMPAKPSPSGMPCATSQRGTAMTASTQSTNQPTSAAIQQIMPPACKSDG